MKFIDVTFYSHSDLSRAEQVIDKHRLVTFYAQYLKHKLQVCFVKHAGFEGSVIEDDVPFHFFKSRNRFWYISLKTLRFIAVQKPDVIMVQGLGFPIQTLALKLLIPKVKIIVQHHGERPFSGIRLLFQKIAANRIDGYFFTARSNALPWHWVIGKKPVYEVLEASTFFKPKNKLQSRATLRISKNAQMFLWVGRLNANKDPMTVLAAFKKYTEQNPNAHLYMVYHTDQLLPQIITYIKLNETLRNAVHLIGKVPHNDLDIWFSAADFYLSASYREGSGYALLEAMACGCIPIATAIPSFKKITANGKFGYLYQPGNSDALYACLCRAANSIIEPAAIRLHFEKELSFEKIAQDVYHAVTGIMKRADGPRHHQKKALRADDPTLAG